MDLLPKIREFVQQHNLLEAGDGVVVGVSGGPDSVCLLHLLVRLREEMGLRLHAAHLHHGARGVEADRDAAFVADLARRWDLPVTVERRDVPAIGQAAGLAFEEAARRTRYRFLGYVAAKAEATRVAVGHTADDQVETVLMHLLRGAGLAGLRGMLPATPLSSDRLSNLLPEFSPPPPSCTLVRPLLETSRADVEQYCAEQGLDFRFDRSNLDTTYFRNRLRHELIPILESYNPNIRQRILHTAEVIAADYDLLEKLRDRAWGRTVAEETGQVVRFDRERWLAEPLSTRRALIRRGALRLRPQLRDVTFLHVDQAERVAREGRTGAQATLPAGLMLTVGYNDLTIADAGYVPLPASPTLPPGQKVPITIPGLYPLPGGEWVLETRILEEWSLEQAAANPDRWTAFLDAAALGEGLILRTRQPGDRFRPQGMGGHRPRLTHWMINAKIPRPLRDRLPLLVAGKEILWVCGWRIAENAAVGPATRRVARFRFGRK